MEKVTRGLYDHVPEMDDEYTHQRQGSPDTDALERAHDDIEAAAERGDGDALRAALERAREAIDGVE